MTERPADLADYRNPPIDEVVVGVQFRAIDNLTMEQLREFHREMVPLYPIAEKQPRLEIPLETASSLPQPSHLVVPLTGINEARLWLINQTDDYLIQLQDTTFIQNWRRRAAEYPRFEAVSRLFWENFQKFRSFLEQRDYEQPKIQQVQVSYLNWIPDSPDASFLRLSSDARISISRTERVPEEQRWAASYLLRNDADLVTRLRAEAVPAARMQNPAERGIQFSLVFRSARSDGMEDDEAADLLSYARIVIVEAFTELTTQQAHYAWDRIQ